MSLGTHRKSTTVWAAALALWAGVAFIGPKVLPGNVTVIVALVLAALVTLTSGRMARPPLVPLAMAVLAILSAQWADFPDAAIIGGGALLAYVVVAMVIVPNIRAADLLRWLSLAFRYSTLTSLALALALPSIGVESRWPNTGAWIGLYVHKNFLGLLATLGIATMLYAPRFKTFPTLAYTAWAAMYAVAIVQSKSSAALVLIAAIAGVWFLTNIITRTSGTRRWSAVFFVTLGVSAVTYVAYIALPSILGLIGRDLTFTGRTRIWSATIDAFNLRPLLGYGYGSAFEPGTNSAAIIQSQTGWFVPHAHNGFLSLMLELGLAGAALGAIFCALLLSRTTRAFIKNPSPVTRWALTIAVVFVLNNIIESNFEGLLWFLAVTASILPRYSPGIPEMPGMPRSTPGHKRELQATRRTR